ncbi:MAG: hypothetical protein EOO22_07245 [Comamonadaceae bacterium]|nr:MAG: hypothetical protein EOO22_07245 [Comamonadaceae bacterium]
MRIVGLIGLVLALLIVALLARKQSGQLIAPTVPEGPGAIVVTPGANERERSQQIQEQVRRSLESAAQPRAEPDAP